MNWVCRVRAPRVCGLEGLVDAWKDKCWVCAIFQLQDKKIGNLTSHIHSPPA